MLVEDRRDGLAASGSNMTDLSDNATMERMLEHFRLLLEPSPPVPTSASTAGPAGSQRTAADTAGLECDRCANYPADATLVSLFEQQVARHLTRSAVQFGQQSPSYFLELNERANQLAHVLRAGAAWPPKAW